MTCREFADFIGDYFSGELPPPERELFERHLTDCPNCRTYLSIYEETTRLGRRAFDEPANALPPEVPDRLVQAILAARRTRGDK